MYEYLCKQLIIYQIIDFAKNVY
ncbi:MAG: hypothetical protein PWR10_1909, partial [Halanaerobiales bacterium]|nr:hypothetical protein [Halanaerobiales bacterium]MDI3548257.1 hypothetical protein [Halanaerobiales bacterium]